MNFKITNDKDEYETIKVEISFHVDTWKELEEIMNILENHIGV